jgi:hypothetical protein
MSSTKTIARPSQPDIQYHPDWAKYQARSRQRKKIETLQTSLPAEFPQHLVSPLVWDGKDIEKRDDWIYQLSDAQLDEIDAALMSFKGKNVLLLAELFN